MGRAFFRYLGKSILTQIYFRDPSRTFTHLNPDDFCFSYRKKVDLESVTWKVCHVRSLGRSHQPEIFGIHFERKFIDWKK